MSDQPSASSTGQMSVLLGLRSVGILDLTQCRKKNLQTGAETGDGGIIELRPCIRAGNPLDQKFARQKAAVENTIHPVIWKAHPS